MKRGWLCAAGAGRQCAPAALIRRHRAALNFTVRRTMGNLKIRRRHMVLAWALCLGCGLLGMTIAAAIWSALPVSLQPPAADRIHRVLGGTLVSLGFLLCSGVGLLLGVR